ncbi:MAG: CBS domain-containing protein [Halobacteria archaeon]
MPLASEIARPKDEVVTIQPDENVRNAARKMEEKEVGCIVVVEDNHPTGVLTDRDIVLHVTCKANNPREVYVEDVMSDDPVTAPVDADLSEVIEHLGDTGVRRLPLVDDDGIAGILTLDDVVMMLSVEQLSIAKDLDSISSVIKSESPPY